MPASRHLAESLHMRPGRHPHIGRRAHSSRHDRTFAAKPTGPCGHGQVLFVLAVAGCRITTLPRDEVEEASWTDWRTDQR
jgi:hypothetical protein